MYNELRVAPAEHPVILTEQTNTPRAQREDITRIMFESFDVPALYIANKAVLACFASGVTTGLVVDMGANITVTPVIYGSAVEWASQVLPIGDAELVSRLLTLITEKGYTFTTAAERDMLRDALRTRVYVCSDFQSELLKFQTDEANQVSKPENYYETPDGSVIELGDIRFRSAEILFSPSLCGIDYPGLDSIVFNTIASIPDLQLRQDLAANIILAGTYSCFPGLDQRLHSQLSLLFPSSLKIKIHQHPSSERRYLAWIGGSILSTLPSFSDMVITKAGYDETGPQIVHRKCW